MEVDAEAAPQPMIRRSLRIRSAVDNNNNNDNAPDDTNNTSRKRSRGSGKSSSNQQQPKNNKKLKMKAKPPPTAQRKNPKRKSAPQYLNDSEGNMVRLVAVNLSDISKAEHTGKHPFAAGKNQHYLHTVTSPTQRAAVYERAQRALEDIEVSLLPTYGGRPWKVHVTVSDPTITTTAANISHSSDAKKKTVQSPYFVFSKKGKLEIAAWPHVLLKIPAPPKFPGYYSGKQKRKQKQATDEEEADDQEVVMEEDEDWLDIVDLQERDVTPLSELAFGERWRVPLPLIVTKWISPLREIFTSRKSAWEHAVQLCKQDCLLSKVLEGFDRNRGSRLPRSAVAATTSAKRALEAGRLRFARDGLWVVGQEDAWKEEYDTPASDETAATASSAAPGRPLSALQYYIQCNRLQLQKRKQEEQQQPAPSSTQRKLQLDEAPKKASFTLKNADDELRCAWRTLSVQEKEEWKQRLQQQQSEGTGAPPGDTPTTPTNQVAAASPVIVTPEPVAAKSTARYVSEGSDGESSTTPVEEGDSKQPASATTSGRVTPSSSASGEESAHEAMTPPVSLSPIPVTRAPPIPAKRSKPQKPAPWMKWCLNPDQIKLCYDAGMDHYDTVIETVKARDLHRELQDGFDVLRERGRGRFDMELPAFDNDEQFGFLTSDTAAPWMPVVRQVLGKDVVLIHKGMFLSMPGAEAQQYHQDGLHLTTTTQRDCHAVNVFVPLVDLTLKHGPTEFCLGTHILDQEEYDPEFTQTPLVKAGTPIMFDYRLGHKGLGNTSGSCRPIVYCTYAKASNGKEFRDTVNFSRTRYHRIGDLVSHKQVPTRNQRAEKRQRIMETQQLQREHQEIQQAIQRSLGAANQEES